MSDLPAISADLPELRLLAQFAGVAPSRLATAINDPIRFIPHLTLDEVKRFQESCERLSAFQLRVVAANDIYITHAREVLSA